MERFGYEERGDQALGYSIFDRKRGTNNPLALAEDIFDAELIVSALNDTLNKEPNT
jgi:hypothetical protein